ncbi:MAG: AraC family transcriptional regulator [Alphaproteobacteria bacterium]
MDAQDVLRAICLTGAVYFDVNARDPWVAESLPAAAICTKVMPEFERASRSTSCRTADAGRSLPTNPEPPIRLEAGDAVIFTGGEGHYMGTEPGRRAQPDMQMYYRPTDRPLPFVFNEFGGSGKAARFVCGYLGCDARPFNPIIDTLPRILHVETLSPDLIRMALSESAAPRAGGETILSKLSELMFLQAIRQYVDGLPPEAKGWLSGLRDRHVGAALALMHGRPAEPWTIDGLAREIGLSRSAFAARFTELMGDAPMHYLGNWRLQLAARLLERPSVSIAQAAAEVGYESEAAFNRAFKKRVGAPPGAWRRSRQPGPAKVSAPATA